MLFQQLLFSTMKMCKTDNLMIMIIPKHTFSFYAVQYLKRCPWTDPWDYCKINYVNTCLRSSARNEKRRI